MIYRKSEIGAMFKASKSCRSRIDTMKRDVFPGSAGVSPAGSLGPRDAQRRRDASAPKEGSWVAKLAHSGFANSLAFWLFALSLVNTRGQEEATPISSNERVARFNGGRVVTPVNQVLTPVGIEVDLPGLRPQALALSPDGQILVTAGKTPEVLV